MEGLLLTHDPDVVVLTETWLSEDIYDSEFVPNNYQVFRKDRDRRGGGVAILYKASLQLIRLPDVTGVEGIFCKVYADNIKYLLGAIYRPPNSPVPVLHHLKEYIQCHVKPGDRIIMTGDFNFPNIDWCTFSSQSCNLMENEMLDLALNFDLLQVVNEPTRIQHGSMSILDLFFLSGNITENISCDVATGISDHKAVLLSLNDISLKHEDALHSFPNFSRADNESIIDILDLRYDDFQTNPCSINDLWLIFKNMVHECIRCFVPKISKQSCSRNPWISRETLHLQRRLKRLKKRARSATPSIVRVIEEVSQQLKDQTLLDKERYFGVQLPSFIKKSPEKFWRTITPSSRSADMFVIDGKCIRDDNAACVAFNNHFKTVFTADNGHLPSFSLSLPPIPDVTISENGVFNLLLNLDVKKSFGPDDIPNAFLKQYAQWCSKYLCVIFRRSIEEGALPDDWRVARVKPLHKTGDKTQVQNYRPISLTSTACKILEHIIHKHLSTFLEEHNVISKAQHGFRKGYSTCTQLIQTIHDFAEAINEGKQTDVIFLDFRKAFDTVSHNKLIYKLSSVIKNDKLITWIKAYLTNRRQFVTLNGALSHCIPVESGVPQGSVLGPLLFIIYINDIVQDLSVNVKLYADDCVLYERINSSEDQIRLNNDFRKVMRWCDRWQMVINFDKTVYMRITLKRNPLLYQYGTSDSALSEVTCYKYLGLWISNNLSWNKHIDTISANALRKIFFLRRALRFATPETRFLAYNTIVRPILEYAVMIWDPYTKININKLERIQKKAVRFIYNSYGRTSITNLIKKSGLPSVTDRNRICRLKFFFQLIHGQYNIDISKIVSYSSGYATRLRHSLSVKPLSTRTNCYKYSYFPRTITEWNNLAGHIVEENNLSHFEALLQQVTKF